MAGNSLKILIQASLNRGLSIGEINKSIQEISKSSSLQKIKIKIEIDSKILNTLTNFNRNINQLTQTIQKQNNDIKNTTKIINQETKAVIDATDAQKKWNNEKQKVIIDPATKQPISTTTTYGNNQNNGKQVVTSLPDNSVKGNIVQTSNTKKDLKDLEQLAQQMGRFNELSQRRSEQRAAADRKVQNDAINANMARDRQEEQFHQKNLKRVQDIDRAQALANKEQYSRDSLIGDKRIKDQIIAQQLAERQNRVFSENKIKQAEKDSAALLATQNKAELQVMNLTRRYGSNVDSAGLNTYLSQLKALESTMPNFKAKATELYNEINKIGASAKSTAGHTLSFGEALKGSLTKMSAFIVGGSLITAPFQFIRDGVTYVNELNKSLTELSVVYMKSQAEVAQYGQVFQELGMKSGILTENIAKGAVEFARQGLSYEDTMYRMEAATKYSAISNISYDTSAKILTATVNSMGVDINRAADVFSYLGDATATSAEEVGQAIQRVGGSSNSIGLEFEKVSSWVATISARTRESAFTIGNSIKSIISRVQSLKENGFDEEDGTQINQVAKALAEVGIKLVDEQGNFRNFGKVMDEIGVKWSSLTNRQQAYLSTTIAGTYQKDKFLNLMEGYTDSMKLYEGALNSAGIANKKFDLVQEGTENKLNKLKNAFTGIYQSSFESGAIRGLIESLTVLVIYTDKIIKLFGVLPPTILLATTAFLTFNTALRTSIATFAGGKLLESLAAAGLRINALSIFTNAYTGSAVAARIATIGLQAALTGGIALAIAGISYAVMELVSAYQTQKAEEKALFDQQKLIANNWVNQNDKITSLITVYNSLSEIKNRTTEEENQYLQVQTDLSSLLPNLTESINSKGQAHLKNSEAIAEEIEKTKILAQEEQKRQLASASEDFEKILDKRKKLTREIALTEMQLANRSKSVTGLSTTSFDKMTDADYATAKMRLLGLQSQFADTSSKIKGSLTSLTNTAASLLGVKINDSLIKDFESIVKTLSFENLNENELTAKVESFSTLFQKLNDIKNLRSSNSPDGNDAALKEEENFRKLAVAMGLDIVQANKLIDSMFGLKKASVETASDVNGVTKTLNKLYQNTLEKVRPLNDAIDKLSQGHKLSSAEIQKLTADYPDLLDKIEYENGLSKITKKALEEVKDKRIEEALVAGKAENDKVESLKTNLASRLLMYSTEIAGIESLAQAKELEASMKTEEELHSAGIVGPSIVTKEAKEAVLAIGRLKEAFKGLQDGAKNGFKFENSINSPKEKADKQETQATLHTLPDKTKEEIDNINNVIKVRENNIKSLERQLQTANKNENYNDSLIITQKLLAEQNTKLNEINTANINLTESANKVRTLTDEYSKLGEQFAAFDGEKNVNFDQWFNFDATASEVYIKALTKIRQDIKDIEGDGKNLDSKQTNKIQELENQEKTYEEIFKQIQLFKQAHIANNEEITKTYDLIDGLRESSKNIDFKMSKDWIDETKTAMELREKSELEVAQTVYDAWDRVSSKMLADKDRYTEKDQKIISDELLKSQNVLKKAQLAHSELWIQEETDRMILAGKSQTEIDKMVLDARDRMRNESWTKERGLIKLTASEQLKAEKNYADAKKKLEDKKNDNAKEVAKQAIDLQKKIFEAQRDVELDGLDKVAKAAEKNHQKKMDNLDDEMKKIEEAYNLLQQSMDRDSATDDYNENLAKAQKEENDIRSKIKELSLDDSIESKAKQVDLEKELADKTQEIQKMQKDRTKEIRKNSLSDELETKKKSIEETKKTEDTNYETIKANNEKIKLDAENKWKGIIENDAIYTKIQEDIMTGHLDDVLKSFDQFSNGVAGFAKVMGEQIDKNLTQEIKRVKDEMTAFKNDPTADLPSAKKNNPVYTPPLTAEEEAKKKMKSNSEEWNKPTTSDARKKELHDANETIGYSIGATYRDGTWYDKDNIPLYHDGGEVGVSGTSQQGWMSKLLSSNEIPAILKKSEIVLNDPLKFLSELGRNALSNVSTLLNNNASAAGASSSIGSINMYVSVNGDKAGGQTVFNTFVKELEKRGS